MNLDKKKTQVILLFLAIILVIILLQMQSPRRPSELLKSEYEAKQELERFQETVRKFVKSKAEMEQRLEKIEINQNTVMRLMDRLDGNSQNESAVTQANKVEGEHEKEVDPFNLTGEIKRGDHCFDSAAQGLGGIIKTYKCHKKSRNQKFRMENGSIKHKRWCLAVKVLTKGEFIKLRNCGDKRYLQKWSFQDKFIKAANRNFCMSEKLGSASAVALAICDENDETQKWDLSN
ncbi:polypeptide N-acetylgalactosaminyltransferase 2-like [Dendronephthya gigantea]|uniref:polypeptide N-acetylgalactosaminyltransferase 2-like n=1 Tax=Dendronephthya gigantea TaxID=151771 RepID=UPI00106C09C7|nr:polypeptide N-acetylgalactosaminyltransferase 2-like [Dendronephthya gigantea]